MKHGTANCYQNWGCRCTRCVEAAAAQRAAYKQSLKARQDETPHGTPSGYSNWGCRCDLCRAAGREQTRQYLARQRANASIAT